MEKESKSIHLAETARFYGDMRFKQFTIFLAWLTIAGAGLTQVHVDCIWNNLSLKLLISYASMLICGVIWVMEVSSTLYWGVNRRKCKELYRKPTFFWRYLNATNAILILYFINYFFWFYCSVIWRSHYVFSFLFLLIGVFISIYSVINYKKNVWTQ